MRHKGLCAAFWQARTSVRQSILASVRFWLPSGHENPKVNIEYTCFCGQIWSNCGTRMDSEYNSSISLTNQCSGDVKKASVLFVLMRVFASVA